MRNQSPRGRPISYSVSRIDDDKPKNISPMRSSEGFPKNTFPPSHNREPSLEELKEQLRVEREERKKLEERVAVLTARVKELEGKK